jgi:hypothetical protein
MRTEPACVDGEPAKQPSPSPVSDRQGDDQIFCSSSAAARGVTIENMNRCKRALVIARACRRQRALWAAAVARQRHDDAFEAFNIAVTAGGTGACNRSVCLLKGKQAKQSLEQFEAARRINPFDQLALGGMCVAYRELGDSRYHDLVDIPSFARAFRLKVPAGYADAAAFNAALSEELLKLHTMTSEPLEQTLRGGTQTPGLLFTRRSKLIEQAREAIAEASHLHSEMPTALSIHCCRGGGQFSSRTRGRASAPAVSHQPRASMGWISSAYYVSLPEALDDEMQRQGWLMFGESHMELGGADRPEHFIKPVVGQLVLFPSYFWHGTVPFQSSQDRLTVAFDVVPGDVQTDTMAPGPY